MITTAERRVVAAVSKRWTGPNTWAWEGGYRHDLATALRHPEFG